MQLDCNNRTTAYIRLSLELPLDAFALCENRQARRCRQLPVHDPLLRHTVSLCGPSLQPYMLQFSTRMVARHRFCLFDHLFPGSRPFGSILLLADCAHWIVHLLARSRRIHLERMVHAIALFRMGQILGRPLIDWTSPVQHEVLSMH